jgi:hypothetical protein
VDKNKVATKDGKAFRTTRVEVEPGWSVADSYNLRLAEGQEISPTGLLTVLELVPREAGLPNFVGRWHEKVQALKIDIGGVSKASMKRFRNSEAGYAGHHPLQLSDRHFQIELQIPGTYVFRGVVSFGLGRDLALGAAALCVAGVAPGLRRGDRIET